MRGLRLVGALVVGMIVLVGCDGGSTTPPNPSGPSNPPSPSSSSGSSGSGSAAALEQGYEQVVRRVLPSVVQIDHANGLGSGVVYDDKGDIVTNAHVVGTATTFQVTLATGGDPMTATLVASYPPDDLAVIKVNGKLPVAPAKFADSGALKVGQIVLAMGNPLGLSGSVSNGIVSALGRTVPEPPSEASPGTTITDMIQTSAAINPGNSGGALVDLSDQVVGVPTLAATDPQIGSAAPGIGFAISSNTVTRIADQIIRYGKVVDSGRAALGITAASVVDPNGQPAGVGVADTIPGGPAAKAGIQAGDIITKVGTTATPTLSALNAALAVLKPGDNATVTIDRGGSTRTLTVTLGTL